MDNQNNQIKLCPACQGWGEINQGETCKSCNGRGAYIQTQDKLISFDLPGFVDYGSRQQRKNLRAITLGCLVLFIITILFISIYIITQIF